MSFRYRINNKKMPGKLDVYCHSTALLYLCSDAFGTYTKVARLTIISETNIDFWMDKITRNKERD